MHKGRLEAFSDGVIAIIITIMVLELKVPHHGAKFADLEPLLPVFVSYVLSFTFIGIYWNNHHHLLQLVQHVSGKILWANLHLLFWLSLVPFTTAWMGENSFQPATVSLYGIVLLFAGIAYYILTRALVKKHGKDSPLAQAVGRDTKGLISVVIYILGIAIACNYPMVAYGLYISVAVMWLVPDTRIENRVYHGK